MLCYTKVSISINDSSILANSNEITTTENTTTTQGVIIHLKKLHNIDFHIFFIDNLDKSVRENVLVLMWIVHLHAW